MQAPLNFPDPRRRRLHDGNAKILLKRFDNAERVEAGSQDVDGVRALVGEKILLDKP
jgi:hypothetical protein